MNTQNRKTMLSAISLTAALLFLAACGPHSHDDHDHDHGHAEEHVVSAPAEIHAEHDEASPHSEDEHHSHTADGMAITAAEPERGFQLSDEASASIGLSSVPLSSCRLKSNRFRLPESSVVQYRNRHAVFIQIDGWYRLEHVHPLCDRAGRITASISPELHRGLVVTEGGPLLRLVHVAAFDASSLKHTH